MNSLYLLKFDFNELFKTRINENEKRFYLSSIRAVTGYKDIEWVDDHNKELPELYFTLPIYPTTELYSPLILVEKFFFWANTNAKILKGDDFLEDNISIAIDIRGIARDQQFYHLFLLISDALAHDEKHQNIKFFLFVDSLFSEGDILFEVLKENVIAKKVYLIDQTGNFLPKREDAEFKPIKFKEKLRSTFPDFKITLQRKLIRRLGHFKVKQNDTHCHRYFYDGSLCKTEIYELTKEYIEKYSNKRGDLEYIFYFSKYSPWLKDSMDILNAELQSKSSAIYKKYKGIIRIEDVENFDNRKYNGGEILVVADMINSGNSIQEEVERIFKKIKGFKSESLLLLSILNGKGKGGSDNKRSIVIDEKEYIASYFVDVDLKSDDTDTKCELCKLKLPHTGINDDDILKLTSFNFWDLSDSAAYDRERWGRKTEHLLKKVTTMAKWFDQNNAYIMYKYFNYLSAHGINLRQNAILIYPDESKNENGHRIENGSTPSTTLAQNLKEFFNVREIGIPRDIIDKYKNNVADLGELDSNADEWITVLKSKSVNNNFIIIDEFHKEGETFESIYRIMSYLKRPPKCYFPVIDFNPKKTRQYKAIQKEMLFLNLYEFNY